MSSLAGAGGDSPGAPGRTCGSQAHIQIILEMMADQATTQRSLARKSGISKTRLGLLLHRNPERRRQMTVDEFESILRALGTNIVEALIRAEALKGLEPSDRERYENIVTLVCEIVLGLGRKLIEELERIGGIDGTEVRKEWAGIFQKGIIEDVSKAVARMLERRTQIAERDDLWR